MRYLLLALALRCTVAAAPATDTWRDVSPHRSAVIQANGIRLHYLDWGGTGDAMLFLAGLGNTAHVFDRLAPKFTGRFHAIGMTRRGFGQSERPDTGYDMPARVADLAGFLDALKIQKAILVGHSVAGDELTAFAAAHPHRVIKLVYLDAAYDRSQIPDQAAGKLQQARSAAVRVRLPNVAADAAPIERDTANLKARFGTLWNEALEAEVRENYERAADGTLKRRQPAPIQAIMDGSRAAKLDYSKLASPSLAFFAKRDPLDAVPVDQRKDLEDAARASSTFDDRQIDVLKKNPKVRVVVLENANHYCWFDRGDDVVREMNAFLN
jgi:pimeloyl-ACP methyl ester carboxylesterase